MGRTAIGRRAACSWRRSPRVGLLALAFTLALGACAHVEVSVEVAPGADLSRYATWALAPASWDHPLVGPSIEAAITASLTEKGYATAAVSQADLLVAYRASGVRRSKRKNSGDPDADVYVVKSYIAGTVVIDMLERGQREPLWRGIGEVDVYAEEATPEAAAAAVKAILRGFPAHGEHAAPAEDATQ